jgi:hypothetical protein
VTAALEDRVRRRIIKYREDYISGEFLFKARRGVNSVGLKLRESHRFIRDHATADMVVAYLAGVDKDSEEQTTVALPQEARALSEGDLVELEEPALGFDGDILAVSEVDKRLGTVSAVLRPKSWETYFYTPEALSPDGIAGTASDFSRVDPTPGTLTLLSEAVNIGTDGHVLARVRYTITLPTVNITHANFLFRIAGAANWNIGAVAVPGETTARVDSLLPGTAYDFGIQAFNSVTGRASTVTSDLNHVTLSDSSVPSAPSAMTVRQGGGKVVEIFISATVPIDWGNTRLYRATSNNPGVASEIATGKRLTFHDQNVSYGTTYYYWAKIEDQSANLSPLSPSSGHSVFVSQVSGTDIQSGTITGSNIASITVNTDNITPEAVSTTWTAINTGRPSTTSGITSDMEGSSITVTISSVDNPVRISFIGSGALSNGHASTSLFVAGFYAIWRDDTLLIIQEIGALLGPVGSNNLIILPMNIEFTDGGISGSHTYKIRWNVAGGSPREFGTSMDSVFQVTEHKR